MAAAAPVAAKNERTRVESQILISRFPSTADKFDAVELVLSDHLKSGQWLSLQNRPMRTTVGNKVFYSFAADEASAFWSAIRFSDCNSRCQ